MFSGCNWHERLESSCVSLLQIDAMSEDDDLSYIFIPIPISTRCIVCALFFQTKFNTHVGDDIHHGNHVLT